MENPKKIALLIVFLILFVNSKEVGNNTSQDSSGTNLHTSQDTNSVISKKTRIRGNLYTNNSNQLFLKIKNNLPMHPSQMHKQRHDSLYIEKCFLNHTMTESPLKNLIDSESFEQINSSGSYYRDTNYLYILTPRSINLIAFQNGDEKFFGNKKDWLLLNDILYFQGAITEGLNNKMLSIIKYPKKDADSTIEFLTDGNKILNYEYPIDKVRLKYNDDLSEETKNEIIRRFNLK